MSGFTIESADEIPGLRKTVEHNSRKALDYIKRTESEPLDAFFRMKFTPIGFHPTSGHELNLIEQINQTFTYLCALEASEFLFRRHKGLKGLQVYPGAHAPKGSLDIEALDEPGLVGAEIFAAVTPRNNQKLKKDLEKLRGRSEQYRYIFFIALTHEETSRQPQLEDFGVEVHSIWPFGSGSRRQHEA